MMNELRQPLVWVDIDSIIHKKLDVFDDFADKCDIGMAFPKVPSKEDQSIGLPKASPIYFTYKPIVIEFLKCAFCVKKTREQFLNQNQYPENYFLPTV
jgi:hypothetical protein